MSPVECKEHAAECRQMAECAPNSRVRAILTDMARRLPATIVHYALLQSGPEVFKSRLDLPAPAFVRM
jgi:hypothetical protein